MAGDAIAVAGARNIRFLRRRGITVRKTCSDRWPDTSDLAFAAAPRCLISTLQTAQTIAPPCGLAPLPFSTSELPESEIAGHWMKIAIAVEQRRAVFDAPGPDQEVDCMWSGVHRRERRRPQCAAPEAPPEEELGHAELQNMGCGRCATEPAAIAAAVRRCARTAPNQALVFKARQFYT
jgi:hypothetical protein